MLGDLKRCPNWVMSLSHISDFSNSPNTPPKFFYSDKRSCKAVGVMKKMTQPGLDCYFCFLTSWLRELGKFLPPWAWVCSSARRERCLLGQL